MADAQTGGAIGAAARRQQLENQTMGDFAQQTNLEFVNNSRVYGGVPGVADTARDFNQLCEATTQLHGTIGDLGKAFDSMTGAARDKFDAMRNMLTEIVTMTDNISATRLNMVNDQAATQAMSDIIANMERLHDYVQRTITAQQDLSTAIREQFGEVDNAKTSMASMASALNEVDTLCSRAVGSMRTMGQNITGVVAAAHEAQQALTTSGVDVNRIAEDVSTQAETVAHQMEEQKAFMQLLADQSTRTEQEIKHTRDQVKQHFKAIANQHALELTNGLQQTLDQLEEAKRSGGEVRFADTFSSAMQAVMERFENFARDDDIASLGADKQRAVLDEMQAFGETMVNAMATNARLMAEYGQRANNDGLMDLAQSMDQRVEQLKTVVKQTVDNVGNTYSRTISAETERLLQAMSRMDDASSPESMAANMQLGLGHGAQAVAGINGAQAGLDAAATALMLPDRAQGWMYRHFDGAFTSSGRAAFQNSLTHAQRVGVTSGNAAQMAMDHINRLQAAGVDNPQVKQKIKSSLNDLVNAVAGNAEANLGAGRQLDLGRGQYKTLSADDKKVVDEYLKSANSTRDSLRTVLRMLNEIDPTNDGARRKIEGLNAELAKIVNTTEDLKNKTSLFDESKSIVLGGIKRVQGLLGAGLGMMGLGALTPTLGNMVNTFGKGGFQSYTDDGRRHYRMALTEAYLGNDVNVGRSNYMVNTLADRYHRLTYGQVGFDELPNRYDMLVRNVGGHRNGATGEQTAADMAQLTELTFGFSKTYGISDQNLASAGKSLYHDMGMSAEETAGAIARMAQAAQTANVPVNKYMSTVVGMVNSLREVGVDGRYVMGMMEAAMAQNMRVEDAQELVAGTARAAQNMAGNWNQSAFWGIMSGQGNDAFGNVVSGLLSHDENGNPNDEWFGAMARRVITRNQFMSSLGGGAGSDLGAAMMMDDWRKQGFSQKWASALTAKAMSGDEEGLAKLLKQAENEKDGGQKALAKGMSDANEKLAAAAEQLGVTTKTMARVDEARKAIGESIRENLSGPLNTFADGVGKFMQTVGESLKRLIDGIAELLKGNSIISRALRAGGNFAMENPGTTFVGGLVGMGVASTAANFLPGWLGKKAISWLTQSGGASAGVEAASAAARSGAVGVSDDLLAAAAANGGSVLADSSSVAASSARMASNSGGWFSNLLSKAVKPGTGGIGKGGGVLSAVLNSGFEVYDAYAAGAADPYSGWQHALRAGVKTIGGIGGAVAGSAVAGPLGTVVGGYIGNELANGILDLAGLGDDKLEEAKRLHAKAATDKEAAQEETVRMLSSSNNELGNTVQNELRKHGESSESLASEQKKFMADMFNKLMAMPGMNATDAATLSAQLAAQQDKLSSDAADKWMTDASFDEQANVVDKLREDKNWKDYGGRIDTASGVLRSGGADLAGKSAAHAKETLAEAMNLYNRVNAEGGDAGQAVRSFFASRYVRDGNANALSQADMGKLMPTFGQVLRAHNADKTIDRGEGGYAASDIGSSADALLQTMAGYEQTTTDYAIHAAGKSDVGKAYIAQATRDLGKGTVDGQPPGVHFDDGKNGIRMSSGIQMLRKYADADSASPDKMSVNTVNKLGQLAKWWDERYGSQEKFYMSSTTGDQHAEGSDHYKGLAADVAMDLMYNDDIRNSVIQKAQQLGLNVYDEYVNRSENWTGGHLHIYNPDDSDAMNQTNNVLPGDNAPQGSTARTADDALRNAAAGAQTMQQQIREYYGLADASKDKIASGQLVVGNVSTLGMLQGRMANYRGVKEDFERFSGITDASRLGYGLQGAFTVENGIATFRGMDPRLRRKQFDESMKNIDFRFLENGEREVRETADALMSEQERVSDENERIYRENHPTVQDARTATISIIELDNTGTKSEGIDIKHHLRVAKHNEKQKA